ncbi:MAG: hypothetical protein MSH48_04765 [Mollicutes bacterium]|nr:hypothetical protein [Mollicutes bacterium]
MNEKKIYIVLTQTYTTIARIIKSITKDKYSHASISLDIKCNNMYSFGRKYIYFPFYGIFLKEDLRKGLFIRNKNALVVIYEIKVTKKQYNKIKDKIKEIELNNKGYNIIGLLLAHFRVKLHRRKYYCSEFVYEVLSNKEIEIYNKENTLFKPEELITNNRFVKIFEGKIRDYIAIC